MNIVNLEFQNSGTKSDHFASTCTQVLLFATCHILIHLKFCWLHAIVIIPTLWFICTFISIVDLWESDIPSSWALGFCPLVCTLHFHILGSECAQHIDLCTKHIEKYKHGFYCIPSQLVGIKYSHHTCY